MSGCSAEQRATSSSNLGSMLLQLKYTTENDLQATGLEENQVTC